MKLNKVNGLYHKPRLREWKPPFWLSAILIATAVAGAALVVIRTYANQPYSVEYNASVMPSSLKVIAVGDIVCSPDDVNYNDGHGVPGACQMGSVARAIGQERADAVLLLGDLQYNQGLQAEYQRSFAPFWRGITAPMYVVPGNHDYGNGQREPSIEALSETLKAYFPHAYLDDNDTPGYYTKNISQVWKIIGLNSNCEYVGGCGAGSRQLNWLGDQVKNDPRPCTIAFWHHPVFTSGTHNVESDTSRGIDFWRTLEVARADIVLTGHDHDYERFAKQSTDGVVSASGMREFVVGTGGMNLRPLSSQFTANHEAGIDTDFGYLVLKLYPGRYEWQFKSTDGRVLDNGQDQCVM